VDAKVSDLIALPFTASKCISARKKYFDKCV